MKSNSTNLSELEERRNKLETVIKNKKTLIDPEVIKVSQELDRTIVEIMKKRVASQ